MERKKTKTKPFCLKLSEWEMSELEKAVEITKQSKTSFITMAMLEKTQKIKGEKYETEKN